MEEKMQTFNTETREELVTTIDQRMEGTRGMWQRRLDKLVAALETSESGATLKGMIATYHEILEDTVETRTMDEVKEFLDSAKVSQDYFAGLIAPTQFDKDYNRGRSFTFDTATRNLRNMIDHAWI